MDPLDLILQAFGNGALAGMALSSQEAVRDSFSRLRAALTRRLGSASDGAMAVQRLEDHPDDKAAIAEIRTLLMEAGADGDQDLLELASHVMSHLDPDGAAAGKYRVHVVGSQGVAIGDDVTQTNYFGGQPNS